MFKRLIYCLIAVTGLIGCHDTETFVPKPKQATFEASAFITVIDPTGEPVVDAKIELGNRVGYTNEDGVLLVKQADMTSATYARVEKSGYFHGSRRFYPTRGSMQYVTVMLTPLTDAGSFSANDGGLITIDDKASLHFPAGAIVDGQGQSYGGEVYVKAYPIHPDDPNLSVRMPGDLVGVNEAGTIGALGSLGMIAVELSGTQGQKLQVGNDKLVEMQMQIPISMQATAPSVIPMWSFDESAGVWKQEGEADRNGNKYVAHVPHFSYWNYDVWFPLVNWSATFVYENGEPASQLPVCLTILSLQSQGCGMTNSEGVTSGLVAANEEMLLEIRNSCGQVFFLQNIGPFTDDTSIGPIVISSTSLSTTTITGSAVDCDLNPVTNGYVNISIPGRQIYAVPDETDGSFSITYINCAQSESHLKIVDVSTQKESQDLTFPYAENINAGTVSVCDALTEFIEINIDGVQETFFFYFPNTYGEDPVTIISAQDSLTQSYFHLSIYNNSGIYQLQTMEIGVKYPGGQQFFGYQNGSLVITNYGQVGEFITGTFSGTVNEGQGGPEHQFTGSFSVLRE